MHLLARLTASPMLNEFMRRLREASIRATCANESTVVELIGGHAPSVAIWLADEPDLAHAAEILREVQATARHDRCPSCDYDVRGHVGAAMCPECGASLTAPPPDVTCPRCREPVPDDFEVCWNCGVELAGREGA